MPLTDGSVIGFDGQAFQAPVGTPLTHQCGAYRLFLYQLVDQEGTPIQPGSNVTVTVNETFTDQSGDTSANVFKGSAPTNNAGYVADVNGLLTSAGSCVTQAYSSTSKQHFSAKVEALHHLFHLLRSCK